jgi:hypothetical protein
MSGGSGGTLTFSGTSVTLSPGGSINVPRSGGDISMLQFNSSGGYPQVFSNNSGPLFLNKFDLPSLGSGHILSLTGSGGFDILNAFTIGSSNTSFLQISTQVVLGSTLTIPSNGWVQIDSGGTLTALGGISIQSGGHLQINGGGTLVIGGGQTLTVGSNGVLILAGTRSWPALIRSNNMSPYSIVASPSTSQLMAANFRIESGTIDASASNNPNFFLNGTFSNTPLGATALRLGTLLQAPLIGLRFETDVKSVNYTPINASNLGPSDALAVDIWVAGADDDAKSSCVNGSHLKWNY